MPQENNVLRCYSCETFQVHIVKKAKKWQCKVCNEKQSFIRHYGIGSGKDCRTQVMKLNELHRKKQFELIEKESHSVHVNTETSIRKSEAIGINKAKNSKWLQFLDKEDFISDEEVEEEVQADNDNLEKITKKRKVVHEVEGSESSAPNNQGPWESPKNSNLENECGHTEEVVFDINIEVPVLEQDNSGVLKFEETKKRKFSEYWNDTTKNSDRNSNLKIKVTNCGSIFSSDPNDLDDIMNINF